MKEKNDKLKPIRDIYITKEAYIELDYIAKKSGHEKMNTYVIELLESHARKRMNKMDKIDTQ